jgi:hypothetical protein
VLFCFESQLYEPSHMTVELQSTITCPKCGHRAPETMPTDACQYIYGCKRCGARLKPKKGDCCVFYSFGSLPCPPKQVEHQALRSQ